MKTIISVYLGRDHIYNCNTNFIGRSGENESTQFQIKFEECLCDSWVYIDFVKPDGTKYKTPKLDIIDNVVIYDVTNELLTDKGTLKAQIVLQNEEGIVWKSTVKTYEIIQSINATDDIPDKEDFITEAQRLLNEVEEGLTPTIGENGNWFILDRDTGKTSRGEKGEKGEKGDAGSVKFLIANELPNENVDDSAIYMIPAGSTTEGNTYEEYIYVDGVWESLGSASVNVDLANYVKKTDIATDSKVGLVCGGGNCGTSIHGSGVIRIDKASNTEIDQRHNYKPIVPSNLEYAIKSGLTVNNLEWSEEEKLKVRDLIGVSNLVGNINTILASVVNGE